MLRNLVADADYRPGITHAERLREARIGVGVDRKQAGLLPRREIRYDERGNGRLARPAFSINSDYRTDGNLLKSVCGKNNAATYSSI